MKMTENWILRDVSKQVDYSYTEIARFITGVEFSEFAEKHVLQCTSRRVSSGSVTFAVS